MKVLITGAAGQMAQPVIKYLSTLAVVEEITLGDLSEANLAAVIEKHGSPKCKPLKLDVRNPQLLSEALAGQDVVLNLVGPYYKFGTTVLEAAIQSGVNYVDIVDDFDTTQQLLDLNDQAAAAGITALIATGASPGLTNILARLSTDLLDEVEEINTSWVVGEANSEYTGALVHLFHAMGNEVPTFKDGKIQFIMPCQQDGACVINFPQPFGEYEVFHIGHPEPVTLGKFIPGVKTVTNRGAIWPKDKNDLFRVLVAAGFTSEQPIPFKGEMVAPLDFFEAMFKVWKVVLPPDTEPSKMATCIEVKGKEGDSNVVYTYYLSDYGEMEEFTGNSAAVGVEMLLDGQANIKGVIAPECLNPLEYLRRLRQPTTAFDKTIMFKTVDGDVKKAGPLYDKNIWHELWEKNN